MQQVGINDFKMPWDCGIHYPINGTTQHKYSGANRVILGFDAMAQGKQPIYATFKQWLDAGHPVKKGSVSTKILMPLISKKTAIDDNGDEKISQFCKGYKLLNVFHYSQVDGYTPPKGVQKASFKDFENAEHFAAATGAKIRQASSAYYRGGMVYDQVNMPPKSSFIGTATSTAEECYYSTLFHELTHWTGAKHRLNREMGKGKQGEKYAFEELVAELGASFLCQDLGISKTPRLDHAQYLKSWMRGLKDTPALFLKAASLAEKATGYMHKLNATEGQAKIVPPAIIQQPRHQPTASQQLTLI